MQLYPDDQHVGMGFLVLDVVAHVLVVLLLVVFGLLMSWMAWLSCEGKILLLGVFLRLVLFLLVPCSIDNVRAQGRYPQ